jgi:PAS domain S-box-containing protein
MDSQDHYRDLLDNANDLIQSVAPDGSFLYVNQAWKRTLGYSDAEIARLKVFDVISPACQDHCSDCFQRIMEGAVLPQVDVKFVASDGSVVDLEGSINCCRVDGNPVATRGIFRDVTERNRIARELKESEERYRQLVEHAPEAILVQQEGRYVYVNPEACRLFGAASPAELIGKSVLSTVHPDCREAVGKRIRQVMETGLPSQLCETTVVRCDGSCVDVDAVGTSITFQGARATQVILRDISVRKAAEAQREEWNRRLEEKVAEKTRHLEVAQAKLIQSEKMATLGEVISGTSHALNNPLAGIQGAIQMLRSFASEQHSAMPPDEWLSVLEGVEQAATRCLKIVEDLISFSVQNKCYFSQTDVNEVLRGAVEMADRGGALSGVEVVWPQQGASTVIEGDYVKLVEVFAAILRNAGEALAGAGRIRIAHAITAPPAMPQIVVRIDDTGPGIPPQQLGKIFDPFFTTKPGRAGLGLTVGYGIIKRHHGDIDVLSPPEAGTMVTVTLPVKQSK